MKRAQLTPVITALIATLAGTSGANVEVAAIEKGQARPAELTFDPAELPAMCRQFLAAPLGSKSERAPWQQRLSLAACRQQLVVAPVSTPQQFGPLVASLDRQMAPSQVIYRDAMARGPGSIRILAAYGLGMTYRNIIVRARMALEAGTAFGGATYGGGYLDHVRALHLTMEALLAREFDGARAAFTEVGRLAEADPAAARADTVTASAVTHAQGELAALR